MTQEELFWNKVDKSKDCWIWTGYCQHGYGYFGYNYKKYLAHRYAYELLVGEIPEGLHLDHLCRITQCVNPKHLEPVTNSENVKREHAANFADNTCRKGHKFTEENTIYLYPKSKTKGHYRQCRTCRIVRRKNRQK